MKKTILCKNLLGLLLIGFFSFASVVVNAQSPADDPGIGGPGSPSEGVGGDGGPVVPLDRDLSIMLIAVGIAYGYKKMAKGTLVNA